MSVGAVNKQTGDRIPTAGMPAIDDALDLTSVNPVQNAIITAALANKQDKTDNNLETTAKNIVGAINEHEGDIDSLKSGLTNYQAQNNQNLEVPNRKNLIDSSAYSNGYFTSEGVFTGNQYYYATDYIKVEPNTDYVVSGFTGGGAYFVYYDASKTVLSTVVDTTTTFKTPANTAFVRLSIKRDGMTNPQLELGTTATAYTSYIPSVESRLETVESGLTNVDVALSVPEGTGKNVLPYPFSDTTKTVNGVTFTDNGDGTISTSGMSTARTVFYIQNNNANLHIPAGIYTCSKSYQNTYTVLNVDAYNGNTWVKSLVKSSSTDDVTFTVDYDGYDRISIYLEIQMNIVTDNMIFKPMIRKATITDPTFAPYIPSVDARLDAVESGLTNKQDKTDNALTTTAKTVIGAINELDTDFSNLLANNLSGLKIKRGYKLNSSDVLTFDGGTYLFITIKPQYSQSAIYALDDSENSPQLIAGKDLSITKTVSDGRITVSFSGSYLRFVLIRVDASVNFADEIHLSVATPTP